MSSERRCDLLENYYLCAIRNNHKSEVSSIADQIEKGTKEIVEQNNK